MSFVTIGYLKMLDLNLKNMFVMDAMISDVFGISKNEVLEKLNNSVAYDRGVL